MRSLLELDTIEQLVVKTKPIQDRWILWVIILITCFMLGCLFLLCNSIFYWLFCSSLALFYSCAVYRLYVIKTAKKAIIVIKKMQNDFWLLGFSDHKIEATLLSDSLCWPDLIILNFWYKYRIYTLVLTPSSVDVKKFRLLKLLLRKRYHLL